MCRQYTARQLTRVYKKSCSVSAVKYIMVWLASIHGLLQEVIIGMHLDQPEKLTYLSAVYHLVFLSLSVSV